MSEIKKYAKDHFSERMSVLRCLTVPEWGNGKVYYKQSMNFRDQGAVLRLHADNKPADAVIMTLILKSLDKDGKKLFSKSEMTEISLSYSPEVVSRIVTEMSDDEPVTVEDAAKN